MTIETLVEQLNVLTEQVAKLDAIVNKSNTEMKEKKEKKPKKEKKEKSTSSDDEKPKRISGYILFSKANRADAIETLQEAGEGDAKVKSTDVMKELGRMWKELEATEKEEWNIKAKAIMEAA
jgi:hypothetical protein